MRNADESPVTARRAAPRAAPPQLTERLRRLVARETLSDLDAHFAALMFELAAQPAESVALAAGLASRAVAEGDVCIDLAALADRVHFEGAWRAPELRTWCDALLESGVAGGGGERRPLVLDGTRLYLYRYWRYETALAENLRARASVTAPGVDEQKLQAGLERHFGAGAEMALQRAAAATAVRQQLSVISGGPGTGKTTTVAKVLALLAEQQVATPLSIALAAPTGKAAARLQQAVAAARSVLEQTTDRAQTLPREAYTLHRLLGLRSGGEAPRFDADRPLPFDVLVVDEASMIDVALAAKLLAALAPAARLILLGDKDQLAAVEAGAVLSSLCAGLPRKNVALLEGSRRFAPASGIARFAFAIREGDADAALTVLADRHEDLGWMPETDQSSVIDAAMLGYEPLVAAIREGAPSHTWLATLDGFRVLCATRGGAFGVQALNRGMVARLQTRGLVPRGARYFPGQPLMVTRNDYALGLFNGDVGIVVMEPHASDGLAVAFPTPSGELRHISTARLPACETVYAMTVHKSQGSEFDATLIVLPPESSPILSRELLYTAVTRAMRRATVFAAAERIREAAGRSVASESGLRARL